MSDVSSRSLLSHGTQIDFSQGDWKLMKEVVETLYPIYLATDKLQSDSITASAVGPIIKCIHDSLKPNGHPRGNVLVPDRELTAPTLDFRRQLLDELKNRFKFLKGGLNNAEKKKVANQFLVPAYLTPKHRDLAKSVGAGTVMIRQTEDIIRSDMKELLEPVRRFLDDQYRQWQMKEAEKELGQAELGDEAGGDDREDSRPSKRTKVDHGPGGSLDALMELYKSKPSEGGGAAAGNDDDNMDEEGEEKEQEQQQVTVPDAVISKIINDEMNTYSTKVAKSLSEDKRLKVSGWWSD